jgi:hypothetical protein
MTTSPRRIVPALLALLACSGCVSAHRRAAHDFDRWQKVLTLTASAPPRLTPGKPASFEFNVKNEGKSAIEACLGDARELIVFPDAASGRKIGRKIEDDGQSQEC